MSASRATRSEAGLVPVAVALLCVLYFLAPNPRLDFSAFDTRDAESYLALSRSLVTGLGYTRNLSPDYFIPHTTWPPGLPLLLMPMTALGGVPINLLIVKLGMIAYGVCGIVLASLYARRVTQAPLVRLAVPLLLGLNPFYWQFSRMTDSEMPMVVWSLVALLLADIGWARGTISYGRAMMFGIVCGLGMLIRGSFYGALFLPLTYLLVLRTEPVEAGAMARRYLCYAAGFLLPFASWVARNRLIDAHGIGPDGVNQLAMFFRVSPVDPSSPFRSGAQILADALANLEGSVIYQTPKSIVPGFWSPDVWSGLGSWAEPVAACLSAALVLLSLSTARNLPVILMYGSMAALNIFYGAGAMTRLWVPVTCLLALSLPIAAERLPLPRRHGARASVAAAVMAALAVNLVAYAIAHEQHPYRDPDYAALASLFADIRQHDRVAGPVLTPNPQAFALFTGIPAPMSAPGIGVEPRYADVILPTLEWQAQPQEGTVVAQNGIWTLVALDHPMTLAEFRRGYNCAFSSIAAFAVLSDCMIR